jgi:hypothetical protein
MQDNPGREARQELTEPDLSEPPKKRRKRSSSGEIIYATETTAPSATKNNHMLTRSLLKIEKDILTHSQQPREHTPPETQQLTKKRTDKTK